MIFSFQYLRVIAALLIVAYHAEANVFSYLNLTGRLPALFSFGYNYVSLFFILSGFVISYSCYSKPRHGFSLVKSRLVRLYLTYLFVALLVILSVVAIPSAHNSGSQFSLERLLRSFVFDLGGQGGYVYVSWTLWYEMISRLPLLLFVINSLFGCDLHISTFLQVKPSFFWYSSKSIIL